MEIEKLHPNDRKLLKFLEGKEKVNIRDAVKETGLNKDAIMRSSSILKELKLVNIKTKETEEIILSNEGKRFLKEKFPEQRVIEHEGESVEKLSEEERKIGVPWAIKNDWITIKNKIIFLKKAPAEYKKYNLFEALEKIEKGEKVEKEVFEIIEKRGEIDKRYEKEFFITATEEGKKIAKELEIKGEIEEIGELTHEIIVRKSWVGKKFRRYNLLVPAEKEFIGKSNPLVSFIEKIRGIFLKIGFEEIDSPEIESAFWNFDALFSPQDHPARDLQDTFYMKKPSFIEVPKFFEKVKEVHEKNWKYKWDKDLAEKVVLRTHTTPASARCLVDIGLGKKKIGKYFCIGRVYRNEATDAFHLAEFHQVEGIVVWKRANLRNLLGYLKEFYKQLGFKEIIFRPHYFPYTEPSIEVRTKVKINGEIKTIEIGGSGIFRPEVSIPLWGHYPVLAWGLSLERPLMSILKLNDMRKFYENDISWIEKTKGIV